jgi:hypothetical protein
MEARCWIAGLGGDTGRIRKTASGPHKVHKWCHGSQLVVWCIAPSQVAKNSFYNVVCDQPGLELELIMNGKSYGPIHWNKCHALARVSHYNSLHRWRWCHSNGQALARALNVDKPTWEPRMACCAPSLPLWQTRPIPQEWVTLKSMSRRLLGATIFYALSCEEIELPASPCRQRMW